MVAEVCEALDPNGEIIAGRLGRESTIWKNNRYVRDFSYLGRPLNEVVYLDFCQENAPFHKANVIVLPEFKGDRDDRELYDLIPFLERK